MRTPLLLHIETATDVCSVALSEGNKLLAVITHPDPRSHASQLAVLIDAILKEQSVNFSELHAVSVSKGPGSYTGLRIGVATAKGLCYAAGIPLLAVDTLQAMSAALLDSGFHMHPDEYLLPMIDARRMEVYGAVFDQQLNQVADTKAEILTSESFSSAKHRAFVLFGSGAAKAVSVYADTISVRHAEDFKPSAAGMVNLAFQKWEAQQFESLAYFEPFYLKEFVDMGKKAE